MSITSSPQRRNAPAPFTHGGPSLRWGDAA